MTRLSAPEYLPEKTTVVEQDALDLAALKRSRGSDPFYHEGNTRRQPPRCAECGMSWHASSCWGRGVLGGAETPLIRPDWLEARYGSYPQPDNPLYGKPVCSCGVRGMHPEVELETPPAESFVPSVKALREWTHGPSAAGHPINYERGPRAVLGPDGCYVLTSEPTSIFTRNGICVYCLKPKFEADHTVCHDLFEEGVQP